MTTITAAQPQALDESTGTGNSPVRIIEETTQYADLGEIKLAYVDLGNPNGETIILATGYGAQLTGWSDLFVNDLIAGGYRVIVFDNRDSGLSTKFENAPHRSLGVELLRKTIGLRIRAHYSLLDMAGDIVGLMDALSIEKAHVAGISMGGLISQIVAAHYPERVLSLMSIMSTTGDRKLPQPDRKILKMLTNMPKADTTREAYVDYYWELAKTLGSKTYPADETGARDRFGYNFDRCHYPDGTHRQLLAVLANGDSNVERLKNLTVPTLVVGGAQDPVCLPSHAQQIASLVPNSELVILEDMGHGLEKGVSEQVTAVMRKFLKQAA